MLSKQVSGLYHITNSGGCTRFDYVKKIVESSALSTEVIPVSSSAFPRKANVPDCELLANQKVSELGLDPMPPWQDAIERYTKTMLEDIR